MRCFVDNFIFKSSTRNFLLWNWPKDSTTFHQFPPPYLKTKTNDDQIMHFPNIIMLIKSCSINAIAFSPNFIFNFSSPMPYSAMMMPSPVNCKWYHQIGFENFLYVCSSLFLCLSLFLSLFLSLSQSLSLSYSYSVSLYFVVIFLFSLLVASKKVSEYVNKYLCTYIRRMIYNVRAWCEFIYLLFQILKFNFHLMRSRVHQRWFKHLRPFSHDGHFNKNLLIWWCIHI